jgi:hypothetical protein
MNPTSHPKSAAVSKNISKRLQELRDWRGEALADVRQIIRDADSGAQRLMRCGKGGLCYARFSSTLLFPRGETSLILCAALI